MAQRTFSRGPEQHANEGALLLLARSNARVGESVWQRPMKAVVDYALIFGPGAAQGGLRR
jgi:hypothetical protein